MSYLFQVSHRLALLVALGAIVVTPAVGQDLGGWDPGIQSRSFEERVSLGVEVGKPLVLGFVGGYHFDSRYSAYLGFASLGDFTAVSADVRWNVLHSAIERPIPFVDVGFTQFYLADGSTESSPLAFQAGLGVDYMFVSRMAWGARAGYIAALGDSDHPEVDRYGISDELEDLFFSVSARILF